MNTKLTCSIPKRWIVGRNNAWNANVIDQSAPGWPRFLVERIVEPLWQRGYRGFFLDTLDSYQLVAKTIRVRSDLPVVSIDYCSPTDDRCRREIARKICDLGIVPYVTDGALQTVGRGPGR